jgi:ABC-type sugar transport system ATPase subunit
MMNKVYNLKVEHVSKYYEGIAALADVNCEFEKGKIYGLVGENGAGKSTLVKILNGTKLPDKGQLYINEKKVSLSSPSNAAEKGIGMVYQELNLIPNLSVMENIFVSQLTDSKLGVINWKDIKQKTQHLLDIFHVNINPKDKVSELKVAYQQIVAIIRAYTMNCSLLILDEPTSALPLRDIQTVLDVVRRLKELDCIVIYISHKLDEILELSDMIIALRNGENLGDYNTADVTKEMLVELIAGRKLENKFPKRTFERGEEILRLEHVSVPQYLNDISFSLHKGEILGFAGLLGAGKTEIAKTIFGIFGNDYEGNIYLRGKKISPKNPIASIKNRIGLVPENRGKEGLIQDQAICDNITLASLQAFSSGGFMKLTNIKKSVNSLVESVHIKCANIFNPVKSLSGGNQQKVVIAKWLAANSDVIIFDEPTRGIDVGAKFEIYNLMNELVSKGIGVMIMSSETDEIMNMCDRAILLKEGNITAIVDAKEYTEAEVENMVI